MGNAANCCGCDGKDEEKSQVDLSGGHAGIHTKVQESLNSHHAVTNTGVTKSGVSTAEMKAIVKLQSLWRGHVSRRLASMLRANQLGSSKYFTQEEARETISGNRTWNPSLPREKREKYTFKSMAVYTGEWKGGFRDGYGEQVWPDGARYIGEWQENRAHGKGKFIHVDGDIYEGMWANDKANGNGYYQHVNGAMYQGEWKEDLQHGKGTETWTDESCYQGDYAFGRKHGIGTYKWND